MTLISVGKGKLKLKTVRGQSIQGVGNIDCVNAIEITLNLATNDWTLNNGLYYQTVTASGVTSANSVLAGPDPESYSEWYLAGVLCTSQSTDSLTFSALKQPSTAITVNVLVIG